MYKNWELIIFVQGNDADLLEDGSGRLDAVVSYEAIGQTGKLAWYEQRTAATELWTEDIIAGPPVIGPMSLDEAYLDGNGDMDVVIVMNANYENEIKEQLQEMGVNASSKLA